MNRKETVDINILGQVCPACLLVALKEINTHHERLRKGEVEVVVRTDHHDATRTIPSSAEAMGYRVTVDKAGTYYEIRITARQ